MIDFINYVETWINDYVKKTIEEDDKNRYNYELKLEHTYRVRDNIVKLGRSISLDKNEMKICELIGLLHDIGRFKQYREFKTFSDSISGSHAIFSVQMIDDYKLLHGMKDTEKEIIIKSIEYHNYFLLPEKETDIVLKFSRLIRDADKLDAFYLETKEDEYRKYDLSELSESREYSQEVIEDLINMRQVNFSNFKYKYDRRLGILGLIFNLYYRESFVIVQKNKYIERLIKPISITKEIELIRQSCINYIQTRVKHT